MLAADIEQRQGGVRCSAQSWFGVEYRMELARLVVDRIGGTPKEQRVVFDRVIARCPDCFWISVCVAPCVRDKLVGFRLEDGAKPVARQPIPLSPYDDMRVEFHVEEAIAEGRLRRCL